MKKGILKRTLALVLSGAMVLGGINLPSIQSEAAQPDLTWNSYRSLSGWAKLPTSMLSAEADSENSGSGNADRRAIFAVDGKADTRWHTNWSASGNRATYEGGQFTANNTITLTLSDAQSVQGISFLPPRREDSTGFITRLSVQVSRSGNENEFEDVLSDYTNESMSYTNIASLSGDRKNARQAVEQAEKEILFDHIEDNVKKIKIIVLDTVNVNGSGDHYISASEISVLLPDNCYGNSQEDREIDVAVLQKNATANSENTNADGSDPSGADGPAKWAFNNRTDNWWHSRWQNVANRGEHEVESGEVSESNPIWIQTGFDKRALLTKLTYRARSNGNNSINAYEVQVANMAEPLAVPNDSDFRTVKTGNLESDQGTNQQTIDLTSNLVAGEDTIASGIPATHVRLVAKSVYASGTTAHVTASEIRVFEASSPEPSRNVMFAKAQANSWDNTGGDGPAAFAFDGSDSIHWHSNYPSSSAGEGSTSVPSSGSPIWIQTGFGESRTVSSLYYASRGDNSNNAIGQYKIYTANISDPNGTPNEEDFQEVTYSPGSTQTFEASNNIQLATFTPVQATHIRLLTEDGSRSFVTARMIRVFDGLWPIGISEDTCPVLNIEQVDLGDHVSDVNVGLDGEDSRYRLESFSWKEIAEDGSETSLQAGAIFEEGKSYRLTATIQIADSKYRFTEISKPAEILVGDCTYTLGTAATTIDGNGNGMTVNYQFTLSDTRKESSYWKEESARGTMAQQTDNDVWFYQVKQVSPRKWMNLPEEAFHASAAIQDEDAIGSWMQPNSSDTSANYYYSKITRTQITTLFSANTYSESAYAWKAHKAGYYKAALEENIGATGNNMTMAVTHVPADAFFIDGEVLVAQQQYQGGGNITNSRIAKMEAGDYIRFAVSQGWATGFKPMVEEVTAKEYAQQLIKDAEAVATKSPNVKEDGLTAVTQKKGDLEEAVSDESGIEEKITALEAALDALEAADSVKYESEDGRTGEQPAVPDDNLGAADIYKYMKDISIDVVYKINEGQTLSDANVALFTLVGKNDEFFTVFHNPQNGRAGASSTNGVNAPFWSSLGADTVGHWEKVTFSFIDAGNGTGKFMFSRNGDNKKVDSLNANEYWPPIRTFISLLRSGTIEKVLLGQKTTDGDKGNCTIRDFNEDAAIFKYAKIRSSSLTSSQADNTSENKQVDSDVQEEYEALLAECTDIDRNSDLNGSPYTQETWSHFNEVRTASQGKTTEWEMLDAIDALTEAKDALRTLTVTADYVAGSEGMGDVTAEVPEEGNEVIFTATPNDYCNFLGWYKNQNPEAEEQPVSQELTYHCSIEEGQTEVTLYAKFEVNKSGLKELLDQYADSAAQYTWNSWQEFEKTLTTAQDVYARADAEPQEVSEAVSSLTEAAEKLQNYHKATDATVLSIGTEYKSRKAGAIFDGEDPEDAAHYIQVNVNKDQQDQEILPADMTITWSIEDGKGLTVAMLENDLGKYPSKATLSVEPGAKGTVKATVVTKNGAGVEDQYEAKCVVTVGYEIKAGYVTESGETMGSTTIVKTGLRDESGELPEDSLLLPGDTAALTPEAAAGYVFKGWYKDKEGTDPYEEGEVDSLTYTVQESDSNADENGVITFYAKFEQNAPLSYEKLNEQIKIAEDLKEEDYTEGWEAFKEAFEAAKALKESQEPVTQEMIDEKAGALEAAIGGLVIKTEEPETSKYKVIVKIEKEGAKPTEIQVKEDVYNTRVELHADDYTDDAGVDADAKFVGWKVNDQIISVEPDYVFYIADDITLTPVYATGEESQEVKAQALMSNVIVTQGDGEKVNVKFVGQLVLPEGCKLKQAGLIWGVNKNADDLEVDESKRTVKNASVTAVKTVNKSYQYSVTLNGLAKGKFLSAKVYMYYQDANGNYKWAFSDVTKVINSDGNANSISLVNLGK